MKIEKFSIDGPLLIIPDVFSDARGFFLETFREESYKVILGKNIRFVQDNLSCSKYGTIRGLHFQREPFAQAKLVRCAFGKILDVAVDLRTGSTTYGEYASIELDGVAQQQFFIPRGFAHGFSVLSPEAVVEYRCDEYYHPEADAGVRFDDISLGIEWRVEPSKAIVSEKDRILPRFRDIS